MHTLILLGLVWLFVAGVAVTFHYVLRGKPRPVSPMDDPDGDAYMYEYSEPSRMSPYLKLPLRTQVEIMNLREGKKPHHYKNRLGTNCTIWY